MKRARVELGILSSTPPLTTAAPDPAQRSSSLGTSMGLSVGGEEQREMLRHANQANVEGRPLVARSLFLAVYSLTGTVEHRLSAANMTLKVWAPAQG